MISEKWEVRSDARQCGPQAGGTVARQLSPTKRALAGERREVMRVNAARNPEGLLLVNCPQLSEPCGREERSDARQCGPQFGGTVARQLSPTYRAPAGARREVMRVNAVRNPEGLLLVNCPQLSEPLRGQGEK
ncbi:MAG: hypothetical protein K2K97_07225 [Muribaculaceae bacterium]|nr:hypothetical protein [Muribaculaceae bacterium]